VTGIKILVLCEQLQHRRSKKDQTPFFEECYILQIVLLQVTDTDIANEVRWVIRLLQSAREQIALDNAGAVALFGFPIFCYPWGEKIVFLGLLCYNSLTAFNL